VLAANKPAGMLVHGDGTGVRTLTDDVAAWVVAHGGDALPQALNRIDVATTGLVLFSLAEETQPAFDALVAGHDMDKRYLAVVEGRLKGPRDVTAAIGRDRHDARRMRISASGKPAVTHLRPLASSGRRTLVEARIETGRRHQIRLHLASMGTPIMGDALYGRQGADIEGGLALHAWRLSFEHPVTGERLTLEAPWPPRFDALGFSAAQLVR
jgi:23S rRNA pseudouridine1911/1915/1917 synthase